MTLQLVDVAWPRGAVGLVDQPRTATDERSVTVANVARTDVAISWHASLNKLAAPTLRRHASASAA